MNKRVKELVFILLFLFIIIPLTGDASRPISALDEQENVFQLYIGRIYNPEEKWIGSEWTFELTFNAVSVFYVSEKPPFIKWLRHGETITIITGIGGFRGLIYERFIFVIWH